MGYATPGLNGTTTSERQRPDARWRRDATMTNAGLGPDTTSRGRPNRGAPLREESRRDVCPLLTIVDVAELLAVSVRYVYRLVGERRIPYVKWGRYVRFEPNDLARWGPPR